MPAKSGAARDDHPTWRKDEFEARKPLLRRQVEAGTFGLAQLFPRGKPVDARHLRPLPPPSAVRMPAVHADVAQPGASETPVSEVLAEAAAQPDTCVYKPVMSDAERDACR